MYRSLFPLALLTGTAVFAAPGGPIGTMQLGNYVCELPGDATGAAGLRVPEQDFTILNASSYEAGGLAGTYLLTGDVLVMTAGPKQGQRFRKLSDNFVRLIEADGSTGNLRCVRQVSNNRYDASRLVRE